MPAKDAKIVIVGAGAWGLSTALHLLDAGYSRITLLDRGAAIPSPHSAANDLNKIVRAEYEDPFYTQLALEAIEGWKTPLFGPYFHQTGYVVAATPAAPPKATAHLDAALASIATHPSFARGIRRLDGPADFRALTWQYTGALAGWRGYFNALAGYAHSADALRGVWAHVAGRGVRSVLGEQAGRAAALVYGSRGRCVGVRTADGAVHDADVVVVAAGAHAAALVPGLGGSVVARAWSVAHVRLSEEECSWLRGIPTTNVRDLGFFFEPDPATRLFKVCPLGAGYTNTGDDGVSLPPEGGEREREVLPRGDEEKLRRLLQETFPWMADRPFVEKKLCWFADTRDSDYCVDFVPGTDGSVVCLSGDSGHGFKMMPVFGKWVVELLERGRQTEPRWQWRESTGKKQDWGDAVSWRIGEGAEWRELVEAEEKVMKARL